MEKSYVKDESKITKELGVNSFCENNNPELQKKISVLEDMNLKIEGIMEAIPDIFLMFNKNGDLNPFSLNFGKQNLLRQHIICNDEVLKMIKKGIEELERKDIVVKEFEMNYIQKHYYFEARIQPFDDEVLVIMRNMTERIILEKKLRNLAEQDSLTKIKNRRCFSKKMSYYEGQYQQNLAVIVIDINGLKFINDTLGHTFGDDMIIDAAKSIQGIFEPFGVVARIGGDEFGIIIEDIDTEEVENLLRKLKQRVAKNKYKKQNKAFSLAYGYAHHQKGILNMKRLFEEADNHMYQNKLLSKESLKNTFVKTFLKILEAKDFVSKGHAFRMGYIVELMGRRLHLQQDCLDRLLLLAKFHDIGKIGIPDDILKKPSALSQQEWRVMQSHTHIGERIALEAAEIKVIAPLILKHHERWDGSGYPLGIKGEEIPIECRILAIADTFDSITSDRPYRKAQRVDFAVNQIVLGSGSQFDPKMVGIFLGILEIVVDKLY